MIFSRRHAFVNISPEKNTFHIKMNSKNGGIVDGVQIEKGNEVEIDHLSTIQIGFI